MDNIPYLLFGINTPQTFLWHKNHLSKTVDSML